MYFLYIFDAEPMRAPSNEVKLLRTKYRLTRERLVKIKGIIMELNDKLKSLYTSLTGLMNEVSDVDKFSYTESEMEKIYYDGSVTAINERIANNRYRKINAIAELMPIWKEFKSYYKDDLIINKIASEMIKGKFDFTKEIEKTILEYPERKQVLYYFSKNEDLKFKIDVNQYNEKKNEILSEIKDIGLEVSSTQKNIISAINTLKKSSKFNEQKPLNGMEDNPYFYVLKQVKKGNFKILENNKIEIPLKDKNNINEESMILNIDFNKPLNTSVHLKNEVNNKENVKQSIQEIRNKSLNTLGNNLIYKQ